MRNARRWMVAAFVGLLAACSSDPDPKKEPEQGELEIVSFKAVPATIAPGGSTILSWTVENAATIQIFGGDFDPLFEGSKPVDSVEVFPTETTTYRLEAVSATGHQQEKRVTVEVKEDIGPEVGFSVDPTRIDLGATAKLSWTTTDVVRVVISDGGDSPIFDSDNEENGLSGDHEVKPDTTTVYELEATAEDGSQTRVSAELIVDPVILSFESDQTDPVAVGTEIELKWTTSGAEELTITTPEGQSYDVPATDRESGEANLAVGASGRFTLTATRGKGEATMEYVVGIVDQPRIITLSATPDAITLGETNVDVTVRWVVEEATSITLERVPAGDPIDLTGLPIDEGSVVVRVSAATTLLFTASNGTLEISQELEIEAIPAPMILAFEVDAERYAPGDTVQFEWAVTFADALQILDSSGTAVCTKTGAEEIAENGCQITAPSAFGVQTYTLKLTNSLDQTATDTVDFVVSDGPAITIFTALPSRISQGDDVVFSWQVLNSPAGIAPTLTIEDEEGDELVLPELGAQPNAGTASMTLDEPGAHTFTLRASTPGTFGSVATADVQVIALPIIATLTATPDHVTSGQTTIAWTTQFANSVTLWEITGSEPAQRLHTFSGASVQSGSFAVTPSVSSGTVTYRLVAKNELDAEVQGSVDVTVASGVIPLFTVSPSSISAGDMVTIEWNTTGGAATLSPFVDLPATELTPAAPYTDISLTGTPINLGNQCVGQSVLMNEGCTTLTFPDGFTFPFDGQQRAAANVYVNGFLSFDIGHFAVGSAQTFNFPTANRDYVHIAPYWSDLTMDVIRDAGMFYELRDGPKGQHLIIQWHHVSDLADYFDSDLNIQVTLWPNGAFDFAYGPMRIGINNDFDAWFGIIGYQDTTGDHSHMISGYEDGFFSPGIQNRSWRYFQQPLTTSGTTTATFDKTTILTLCVDLPTHRECQDRTVVVD